MKQKFKEIYDDNGIYIEPLNMDATMKEIEHFIEQIVIECAAVCEEHPSYGGRMLADLILKKFEIDLRYAPDDGSLTDQQIKMIRAASSATNIPSENFKDRLF